MDNDRRNLDLSAALAEAEARYAAANPKSRAEAEQGRAAMPGGNTRTIIHFDPFPLTWAKGEGNRLADADGHVYTDFLGEFTAGLYGHNDPVIQDAVRTALADGIVLGGPNGYEGRLAQAIVERFPSLDLVRFCNSGTEANMLAVQTARHLTGKPRVMTFEAGYHGSVLYFGHRGNPLNLPVDWLIGTYNEVEATRTKIADHADTLAAVLVEPMQGAGGCLPATPDFLAMLRDETARHGIVLIFDEVMTSRLSPSGLQGKLGIAPDMTTLGKYLGGGLSFGAFGGRRDLMERFDPGRPDAIGHAGTFNNNVLSMAAGLAGLTKVFTAAEAERINALGDAMRDALNAMAAEKGAPVHATGVGSLMTVHFSDTPVRGPADAHPRDPAREAAMAACRKLFHLEMMARGHYLARRGFVALSLPMTQADVDAFVAAADAVLDGCGPAMRAAFAGL